MPAVVRRDLYLTLNEPWIGSRGWTRLHWGAKGRLMQGYARDIRSQLQAYGFDSQFTQVEIEALRLDWRRMDRDNLVAGLKPVLDAMVARTSRNPHGIGLILDDRPSLLGKLDVHQEQLPQSAADQFCSRFVITGVVVPAAWSDAGTLCTEPVGT